MEEVDRLRALVDRLLGPRERLHPRLMNIHEVLERVKQLIEVESEGRGVSSAELRPISARIQRGPRSDHPNHTEYFKKRSSGPSGPGRHHLLKPVPNDNTPWVDSVTNSFCAVDIIDPGPGIPPDILPQLFLPMVSSRAKGAGLGPRYRPNDRQSPWRPYSMSKRAREYLLHAFAAHGGIAVA